MKYRVLEYAKIKRKAKRTIQDWVKKGKVKSIKEGRTVWIIDDTATIPNVAIYARVNSYGNNNKLEEQVTKLTEYCNTKGYNIIKVVRDFGYNTDEDRTKLNDLLIDNNIDIIVVENKNILVKFGFNYINKLLSINNRKVECLNEKNKTNKDELLEDFSNILSSYGSELFGEELKVIIKKKRKDRDDTSGEACG